MLRIVNHCNSEITANKKLNHVITTCPHSPSCVKMIWKQHRNIKEVVSTQAVVMEQVCTCWRNLIWMELAFHSCTYSTIIFRDCLTTFDHVSHKTQDPWKESKPKILRHCQYHYSSNLLHWFWLYWQLVYNKKEGSYKESWPHLIYWLSTGSVSEFNELLLHPLKTLGFYNQINTLITCILYYDTMHIIILPKCYTEILIKIKC